MSERVKKVWFKDGVHLLVIGLEDAGKVRPYAFKYDRRHVFVSSKDGEIHCLKCLTALNMHWATNQSGIVYCPKCEQQSNFKTLGICVDVITA